MKEKIAKILCEYVIHCDTENKAVELLRMLHSYGYVWLSGDSLLAFSYWECYEKNTYYKADGYRLTYGTIAINLEKEIITFDEFKERLNMEKEIKIKVPEGYEIDEKNSTFECIKFKPIKKVETYDDVARELFLNKKAYFIYVHGKILDVTMRNDYCEPNNYVTRKQAEKLLVINKLMNVASYLNKDWKPDWNNHYQNKFYIFIKNGIIDIDYVHISNDGVAVFPDEETAKRAIEILREETIRLALGDY